MLFHLGFEGSIVEVLLCHEDAGEILVLEGYPVESFRNGFFGILCLAQVVEAVVHRLIGQRGVTLFEVVAFLHLAGPLFPFDAHRLGGRREEILQAAGLDGEVHHVGIRQQAVVEIQVSAVGCIQPHGHGGVGHVGCLEIHLVAQDVFSFSFEAEIHGSIFAVKQNERLFLLVFILFQQGLAYPSAFVGEGQLHQVVFQYGELFRTLCRLEEEGGTVRTCSFDGCRGLFLLYFLLLLDDLLNRVLIVLCACSFFLAGAVVDTKTYNHRSNQDKAH